MNPGHLRIRDLRRLVSDLWTDPRCDRIASAVVDAAVAADAKSCDRAVLLAYLRHFPSEHPTFERLRNAASLTAERRDWPWRERGRRWLLWDPAAGPAAIAKALLATDDPLAVLRASGLDGDVAQGEFVAEALEVACEQAGAARNGQAVAMGTRLIAMFEQMAIGGMDALLAEALLVPWIGSEPPKDYRERMTKLLVARVGDPRFQLNAWQALIADMGNARAASIVGLVRRWLTDTTVREFFKVVGTTTNDPAQWAEREAFWVAYLDANVIETAWFALGNHAEQVIRSRKQESRVDFGRITGERQYADPSHSSLVLSIGDLRIAEWSHNGACRFWSTKDHAAPQPYGKQYFGYQLRAMSGGTDFCHLSHHSNWQRRFARKIAEVTGVSHPRYGSGYG